MVPSDVRIDVVLVRHCCNAGIAWFPMTLKVSGTGASGLLRHLSSCGMAGSAMGPRAQNPRNARSVRR